MANQREALLNQPPPAGQTPRNAEIADRLASLAQLLSAQKENPYKVKAYQRAAAKLRNMSESLQELVQDDADLTQYSGIGTCVSKRIGFAGSPANAVLARLARARIGERTRCFIMNP